MIWSVLVWLLFLTFIIGVALIFIVFAWVLIADTEIGQAIDERIAKRLRGTNDVDGNGID